MTGGIMSMILNSKMQAVDKAVTMYDQIREACVRPDKSITGETLKVYKEIVDWGFLDKYNIVEAEHRFLYVTIIAMLLTKNNQKLSEQNASDGKTKWQIIQSALENAGKQNKKKA